MARPRSEITTAVLDLYRLLAETDPDQVMTWQMAAAALQQQGVIGAARAEAELVCRTVRNCAIRGELIATGSLRGAGRTRPPMGYRWPRPDDRTAAERTSRRADRGLVVQQMLLAWA